MTAPTEPAAIPTLHSSLTELVAAMRRYEVDADGDKSVAHHEMMARADLVLAATPALPVPALTDERILTLAAPLMSDGQGFVRKPELFEVVAFAKVIEADLRAALAAQSGQDIDALADGLEQIALLHENNLEASSDDKASLLAHACQIARVRLALAGAQPAPVSAAPATVDRNAVPSGDAVRAIVRSASTSASDGASPQEYVLAGWNAALKSAAPASVPQQVRTEQAGWIDQFGNVFPLGAYSPTGKPLYLDADKRGWSPLFREIAAPAVAQPAAQGVVLAYAIYGINGRGEHFIRDVKQIPANDVTGEWKSDDDGLGEYWAGNVGLAPAEQSTDKPAEKRPLTRCAAARDGDCAHPECPQLRDNEPHATGRHCPIDTSSEDEQ